jgi:hypothetical protein
MGLARLLEAITVVGLALSGGCAPVHATSEATAKDASPVTLRGLYVASEASPSTLAEIGFYDGQLYALRRAACDKKSAGCLEIGSYTLEDDARELVLHAKSGAATRLALEVPTAATTLKPQITSGKPIITQDVCLVPDAVTIDHAPFVRPSGNADARLYDDIKDAMDDGMSFEVDAQLASENGIARPPACPGGAAVPQRLLLVGETRLVAEQDCSGESGYDLYTLDRRTKVARYEEAASGLSRLNLLTSASAVGAAGARWNRLDGCPD